MTTFLHVSDSIRSPEMRHEIAQAVMDPVIFVDRDGKRILACSPFELAIFEKREDVIDQVISFTDLGQEEIVRDSSIPSSLISSYITLNLLQELGESTVVVPGTFPTLLADHLRSNGVNVQVGQEEWVARRRRKAPWEVEGIERAQRAAD